MNKLVKGVLWWLACAVMVTTLVWYALPNRTEQMRLIRPAQSWGPPVIPEAADFAVAASQTASSPVWGATKVAADAQALAAEDTRWTIAGTYVNAGEGTAVIRFAAKRPEIFVRKGDKLPNGETITVVESDRVCVAARKQQECRPVIPIKSVGF